MAVKIVKEGPDINLTQSQYDSLKQEWEMNQRYTVSGESFETFVRRQIQNGNIKETK